MASVEKMTEVEKMTDVGEMKWRTCFSSISYWGFKLDILKSALQKYLRRREEDKMLWCLTEIYLFKARANTDAERRAAKGIVSNMLNRLIIMMDEEMLFAEVGKYMKCMEWLQEFEESDREDFALLVKICKSMLGARMLRLNSDIYTYWQRGGGVYKVVNVPGLGLTEGLPEVEGVQLEVDAILSKEEKEMDDWKDARDNLYKFITAFRSNDLSCYYWALAMFHSNVKGKARFRRKDCVYTVWEFLLKECKDNEKMRKCLEMKLKQFFVKTRHEQHMWMSSAISIVLNKEKLDFEEDWDIEVSDEEVLGLFKDRVKIEIDDYAIDMHCSAGRKMGRKKAEFALVGCLVVDEDKEYYNDTWRKLYVDLKVNPAKYGVVDNGKRPPAKGKKVKKVKKEKKEKVEKKEKKEKKEKVEKKEKKEKVEKKEKKEKKEKTRQVKLKFEKKMSVIEENIKCIDGSEIEEKDIRICMEKTCGNKVMCFEYDNKIWKESRKSFGYNKDYELVDSCKEMFGLKKIGMERIKANFKIEKIDKKVSSWIGNWKKVMVGEGEDDVVYCLMRKIGDGGNLSECKDKKSLLEKNEIVMEIGKIALFRGIFRVTDFNLRNILIDSDGSLVSIDEGDIGKRKGIFSMREKWLKKYLTADVVKEVYEDVVNEKKEKAAFICSLMEKFGYSKDVIDSVMSWYDKLEDSLKEEGYM